MKREWIKHVLVGVVIASSIMFIAARYEDLHVTLLRVGDPAIQVSGDTNQLLEALYNGTWSGNGASITNIDGANLTVGSTLSAVDGGSVTNLDAANVAAASTLSAVDGGAVTNLSAANVAAGGVLSAVDGNAVTNMNAANLAAGGTLPALDAGSLTNVTEANVVYSYARFSGVVTNPFVGVTNLLQYFEGNLTNVVVNP